MKLPHEAFLLRIFIGESDRFNGHPLDEMIIKEARKRGMAGATVIREFLRRDFSFRMMLMSADSFVFNVANPKKRDRGSLRLERRDHET